jgi:hypothetical protein
VELGLSKQKVLMIVISGMGHFLRASMKGMGINRAVTPIG